MKFWDASAIIPLFLDESLSSVLQGMAQEDMEMIVWWGTVTECRSALARSQREGKITAAAEDQALERIRGLAAAWNEILPGERIRTLAARLLRTHPLRAADALQLAAAIVGSEALEMPYPFICLDKRLREAARREGFSILPDTPDL